MNLRIKNHAFSIAHERIPNVPTIGVTNRTEDGMFVFFQDYDDVEWKVVMEDIQLLSSPIHMAAHPFMIGMLRNFIVLENSSWCNENQWGEENMIGNYLVFGLDKMSFYQHSVHQAYARGDKMHKRVGPRWPKRLWVNRIIGKYEMLNGKLVEMKPEPSVKLKLFINDISPWKVSGTFVDMFREWFGVRFPARLKPVLDGEIEVIEYSTLKKRG